MPSLIQTNSAFFSALNHYLNHFIGGLLVINALRTNLSVPFESKYNILIQEHVPGM